MEKIKIGIVGLGGISGKHIRELLAISEAEIVAICDIDPARITEKNELLRLPPEKCYADYRDLIADPDVMAVEVCTPNHMHAEIAIAAARAGKPVNVEKPLALSYAEAKRMTEAAREAGVVGMTCFSYRFQPAVRYAKHLVDTGALGEIIGLNVAYLKDSALWEGRRLEWRFVEKYAGSGVIGDLGVHLIDLAQLLAGEITGLVAMKKTVVTERPRLDSDELAPVETEDMCTFLAAFGTGAHATFHITRAASGYKNTIRYDVYGTRGSISFDLDHPERLTLCIGEGRAEDRHFETVDVPKEYYLAQEQAFVNALSGKPDPHFPTLADGLQGQRIIDALLLSAKEGCWVSLAE